MGLKKPPLSYRNSSADVFFYSVIVKCSIGEKSGEEDFCGNLYFVDRPDQQWNSIVIQDLINPFTMLLTLEGEIELS